RARHGFRLRRQQLAEDVRLSGRLGLRTRDAERQAALRQLRNALHDPAGHSRSTNASRELPDGEQETAWRRGESGHATDRLLYSEPAAESEEQAESRGVHALLRYGGHLEVMFTLR